MANVSEKNTKKEILAKLEETQKQLAEKNNASYSPEKVQVEREKEACVAQVHDFSRQFNSEEIQSKMLGVVEVINGLLSEYSEIQKAIEVKKSELREIHGIESESTSIYDLVNTHKNMVELLKAEKEKLKLEFDNQVLEARQLYYKDKEELDQKRLRDLENYNYNFARVKKEEDDKFKDECARRKKEFDDGLAVRYNELRNEQKELEDGMKKMVEKQAEIDELVQQIDDFEGLKQEAVDKAVREAVASADKSNYFKLTLQTKEFEGKIALLQSKVDNLQTSNDVLVEENDKISRKLEQAYDKIEALAGKVVDSAKEGILNNSLKDLLKEKQQSNSK